MALKKRGLGRGLDALLGAQSKQAKTELEKASFARLFFLHKFLLKVRGT